MKDRIRLFNVPNLITAANFVCGFSSILMATSGYLVPAILSVYLGAFFDFFDGFFARLFKQQGELGKQLDSLADVVTFGVAPGCIALLFFIDFFEITTTNELNSPVNKLISSDLRYYALLFVLVPVLSLFRLAKFNVDVRQSESFIGLPTPGNAVLITSIPLLSATCFEWVGMEEQVVTWLTSPFVYLTITIASAILLVSELPLFSLKFKTFGIKTNEIRYLFLLTTVIGFAVFKIIYLPFIVIMYIIFSIIQIFAPKQTKNEV